MGSDVKLRAKDIEKSFPGVKALDKVNFAVRKGTVHALCGENGAGKSTLMKIINGIYKPDAGEIFIDEKNDWEAYTADGSPSAQWEIMVLVTEDGAEVLCW